MIRGVSRSVPGVIISLFLFQNALVADHLPASKVARGKPEHVLGGVNVYADKIRTVVQRLGKPNDFKDVPLPDGPKGSGERSYEWVRSGVRMRVSTEYYTEERSKNVVESAPIIVDVWGKSAAHRIGSTGSGLCVGDNIVRVGKLYGSRFQRDESSMTLQWKDETTLVIDFDKMGTITHMQLLAAVE